MHKLILLLIVLAQLSAACVLRQPQTIVITATFSPSEAGTAIPSTIDLPPSPLPLPTSTPPPTLALPEGTLIEPTPNPTRALAAVAFSDSYTVASGDTLFAIAAANGVSIDTILSLNDIPNPDSLIVGQVIRLPDQPREEGSAFKIVPDSRLVRAPGSRDFDVEAFVQSQPGFFKNATDEVDDVAYSGAQLVQRVSLEYSVDARLLLALVEHRTHLLTNSSPSQRSKDFALGAPAYANGIERKGLYLQLAWAADQLNYGYYGWLERGLTSVEFTDGARLLFAPTLNAGTVAVQFMLSQNVDRPAWERSVGRDGLYRTYAALFGDPFVGATEPLVPPVLAQPTLTFPFPSGQTWYFTGGPHGGYGSGSSWSAVDFAPPDDITTVDSSCYVSQFYATAVASGVIARIAEGTVILDLDGDGDESTGWTILYLHIAARDRIQAGTLVQAGDEIGHPSCEGGFSNGTHMHIARRYNGEWIPVDCDGCGRPPLVMSGWAFYGIPDWEYQGGMNRGVESRVADQGRNTTENRIRW